MKKFEVIFYEDERGNCQIADWLRSLDRENSKSSRSMLRKIYFQFERLENEGLIIGEPIVKRLTPTIWELRPIPNRILFAVLSGSHFLLLHSFREKSHATPKQEIAKAQREYLNWLKRGDI